MTTVKVWTFNCNNDDNNFTTQIGLELDLLLFMTY